jgi:membrane glycosyltransferase
MAGDVVFLQDHVREPAQQPRQGDEPAHAPMLMPIQSFAQAGGATGPLPIRSERQMVLRRVAMFGAAFALALVTANRPYQMFKVDGFSGLEIFGLTLFMTMATCLACWAVSAFAGFVTMLRKREDVLDIAGATDAPLKTRTAILAPIYNEDFRAVAGRLAEMDKALARLGVTGAFDFHVLSDTTDGAVQLIERNLFDGLRDGASCEFAYRHRERNTDRKAGNLADWVRRFGGAYDHMIVLDADSLMSGELMVQMAHAMERRPDVGLIQTVPSIIGGSTLFSRWAQFGVRLYGRVASAGLAWWAGDAGSYWGHNAIVRVKAFASTAGLPHLKGRKPFGGHVMSHDVPEAALMRRGGWGVHIAPVAGGSYEQSPPSLSDYVVRDRRWCQGNIQHVGILGAAGLHGVSRSHLLMGVISYLMSPLWLGFLTVWIVLTLQLGSFDEQFGGWSDVRERGEGWSFEWSDINPDWSMLTMLLLLLGPKLMGTTLVLLDKVQRKAFGGGFRLVAGVATEMLMSAIMAPIMMLVQTRALGEILIGRDAGWKAQRRDAGQVSWRKDIGAAARQFGWVSATGVVLLAVSAKWPVLMLASLPLLIGMIIAVPFAVFSARASQGAFLMATPEELDPSLLDVAGRAPVAVAAVSEAREGELVAVG